MLPIKCRGLSAVPRVLVKNLEINAKSILIQKFTASLLVKFDEGLGFNRGDVWKGSIILENPKNNSFRWLVAVISATTERITVGLGIKLELKLAGCTVKGTIWCEHPENQWYAISRCIFRGSYGDICRSLPPVILVSGRGLQLMSSMHLFALTPLADFLYRYAYRYAINSFLGIERWLVH